MELEVLNTLVKEEVELKGEHKGGMLRARKKCTHGDCGKKHRSKLFAKFDLTRKFAQSMRMIFCCLIHCFGLNLSLTDTIPIYY